MSNEPLREWINLGLLIDQAADRLLNLDISVPDECIVGYNKVVKHLRDQRPAIEDIVKAFAKIDALSPVLLMPSNAENQGMHRVHDAVGRLIDMVESNYGLDENEQFHVACIVVGNIASRHNGKVSPTPNAVHAFDSCREQAEKFLSDKAA